MFWRVALLVGGFGCLSVAAGRYEPAVRFSAPSLAIAGLVAFFCLLTTWFREQGEQEDERCPAIGERLVWLALVWILFRSLLDAFPQAFLLPVAFVAWLAIACPAHAFTVPFLAITAIEAGLWFGEQQSPVAMVMNLAGYGAVGVAVGLVVNSKVYRRKVRKALVQAKRDADSREYARDLGLFAEQPDLLQALPEANLLDDPEAGSQPAVESITAAFDLQLELIRGLLHLSTAALLWPDPQGEEFRLRSIATTRSDIVPGPYRVGAGLTGALTGASDLVGVAPVTSTLGGPPYYRQAIGVGGMLAVRLPDKDSGWIGFDDKRVAPLLCVDREDTSPWTEEEKNALRLAAKKLAQSVAMSRQLQLMAQERSSIQRVCIALRELNGVLGLDQVLLATIKAVRVLVRVDFVAISLLEDGYHRVAMAEGEETEQLINRRFLEHDGLVGQVLRIRHPLPAGARCHGPTLVFGDEHRLTGYASLLILPLLKEQGEAVGALVVAAREPEVFSRSRQVVLELIAAQVAVKIDLGQAHEQINRLATTDGLTGLTNRRTFQHGFEMMLAREDRRAGTLSLLLCDIDHFKKINDTYGHPFGDQVIEAVAGVLRGAVRGVDLAARYGGEEFALVVEGADEKGAMRLAERVRKEVESLCFRHESGPVGVTLSLGLALYPKHGKDKESLVSCADQALYQAKQQGRNRVVLWKG